MVMYITAKYKVTKKELTANEHAFTGAKIFLIQKKQK